MFSLSTKTTLTAQEQEKGLKWVLRDGVASQAMLTLTGGAFLVAYALKLGASNAQIGFLAAIPTLSNVFQLLSIRLVERYANRRKTTVYSLLVGRFAFFIMAVIPFLNVGYPVVLLITAAALLQSLAAISAGCWSSWMRDLIPSDQTGTFFSKRMRVSQAVGVGLSLLIALALDYVKAFYPEQEVASYALLFLLGGLVGYAGIFFLAQTPEPQASIAHIRFKDMLKLPFQHRPFRNLIWYNGLWNFSTNLAAPFFTVYLLQRLNYSVSIVIVLTVISQITTIVSLRLWGKYADQYSFKVILGICAPLYLFGVLGWTFTTLPQKHLFTFPLLILLHLLMGFASGGTGLAASGIGLKLAPKEQSVVYLSVISMTNAVTAGVAPIIGGLLADFFVSQELSLVLSWKGTTRNTVIQALNLQALDFFFVFAFFFGLLALYRLGFIQEEGDVEEKVLLQEIRYELQKEMKNLSTITGARAMIKLPATLFQSLSSRYAAHKTRREKSS